MSEAEELRLAGARTGVAARVHGPPDGIPVLALHGWLDNAASFDPLAPWLAGVRLVALDLPGHGRSDHRPPGYAYHFVDYADDVLDAADALGWDRFSLLGHSLGGAVATLVAAARPARVERLALIEALGPLSEEPGALPARLARAIQRTAPESGRAASRYARLEDAVAARQRAGDLDADSARLLVERASEVTPDGVRWRSDPRLRRPTAYRFTEEQVLAVLDAIRAPTRVVIADDGLLPREHPGVQRRLRAIAACSVRDCSGHHHVHMAAPGSVAAAMADFLGAATGEAE